MKTPNPILCARNAGFTRKELFFAIFVVVVFVGLGPFVLSSAKKKGRMTDSLNIAKSIETALKMYAGNADGRFPFARLDGTPLGPNDSSNRALENLMPKYDTFKNLFFNKASAWCRSPAVDTSADLYILKRGQNDWNYVAGLTETSDARWPLIATATISAKDPTYTNDVDAKGGVWGGTDVIIGYVDGSAKLLSGNEMNLSNKTKTFVKRADSGANMLIVTPEWLGPGSFVLAPE